MTKLSEEKMKQLRVAITDIHTAFGLDQLSSYMVCQTMIEISTSVLMLHFYDENITRESANLGVERGLESYKEFKNEK